MTRRARAWPWHIRLSAIQRLGFVAAASIVLFASLHDSMSLPTRMLVTWNFAALAYLVLAWLAIAGADPHLTRERAQSYDQSGFVIFLLIVAAACTSMGAIAFLMGDVKQLAGLARLRHFALSIAALILSWMLIHTVFAFHYAREFYRPNEAGATVGGLKFPDCETPTYLDFAYYSFVIGMTSQVSDVAVVTTEMRRTTLAHGVLSFLFNIAVLALSINVISASL